MKTTLLWSLFVGASLGLGAVAAVAVPVGELSHVQGVVTEVGGKTITVNDRRSHTAPTFSVNARTRYIVFALGAVKDLKVGQKAVVITCNTGSGRGVQLIAVVPPGGAKRPDGTRMDALDGAGGMNAVQGTIASVTPTLTLTTTGNHTVAVRAADGARVITWKPGTPSDMTAGKFVSVQLAGSAHPFSRQAVRPMSRPYAEEIDLYVEAHPFGGPKAASALGYRSEKIMRAGLGDGGETALYIEQASIPPYE